MMLRQACWMSNPEASLQTERLMLRPVTGADVDVLLAVRNDPVIRSTTLSAEMTVERMQLQVRRWLDVWRERDAGTWVMERHGNVIGYVPLDPMGEGYDEVDPEELELGVIVHSDHWGNGFAGEAGLAVAVDAFTRAGLGQLFATVDNDNEQSLALLAKTPQAELISDSDGELLYRLPNPLMGPSQLPCSDET